MDLEIKTLDIYKSGKVLTGSQSIFNSDKRDCIRYFLFLAADRPLGSIHDLHTINSASSCHDVDKIIRLFNKERHFFNSLHIYSVNYIQLTTPVRDYTDYKVAAEELLELMISDKPLTNASIKAIPLDIDIIVNNFFMLTVELDRYEIKKYTAAAFAWSLLKLAKDMKEDDGIDTTYFIDAINSIF